jgi:hypothetical protein
MVFFVGMDGVGYGYVNGVVFGNIYRKASDSHFCSDNNNSNSEWDILSKKHGHGCLISMAPKRYP